MEPRVGRPFLADAVVETPNCACGADHLPADAFGATTGMSNVAGATSTSSHASKDSVTRAMPVALSLTARTGP
ncbi:MAG: hypothetical protein L0211_00440 [Planctomycetaceae bacterium]|nr:hypothetical protein [Planctomycetaceae bacterium]